MRIGTRWLILAVLSFCLVSCASSQLIQFDDKNMANSVKAAAQIKKNWEANSAFMKVAVEGIKEPINAELYEAIKELDKLAAKPDPMTKADVGSTLAWFGRFSAAGVQKVYEKVLPIVLKIIAAAGG
jgi:hypothetical protein